VKRSLSLQLYALFKITVKLMHKLTFTLNNNMDSTDIIITITVLQYLKAIIILNFDLDFV
jgi:hypothetical protein